MWWSEPALRLSATLGLVLGLGACGFTPLYDPGTEARALQGRIDVPVISGAAGFVMREQLQNRLGQAVDPAYVLEVDLALDTTGIALTTDNVTTRFQVVGTAEFLLVPVGGGDPVLGDIVEAVASYSAPESQSVSAFASRVAERNAELRVARTMADRIATRIALSAERLEDGTAGVDLIDVVPFE